MRISIAFLKVLMVLLAVLPVALPGPHSPVCLADSIWSDGTPSLFSDHKARDVGDVLTVLIVERAIASNKAQTTSGNDAGLSFAQGTGLLSFLPEAGLGVNSDFRGSKSTTRSGNLVAKMTARVIEALPGGYLKIQGTQTLAINNERQHIVITGIVRPQDIHPDNTVLSTYIADAEIKYEGAPEAVKRSGILGFLQRFFTGLIDIIF
ncbi:MAG TPA: flagellar basal body L-ring protein FlgH [Firmicutes bacterium]|nr:flagellar basal body L-ring protein FlgH [Bacillota bacterium]